MSMSRIESLIAERAAKRLSLATARALATLTALERAGIPAWVIGSMAKRTFRAHSDVDFLVDCDRAVKHAAFRIVETEMKDFPFHFVSAADLDDADLIMLKKEAVDASGIRACARPAG